MKGESFIHDGLPCELTQGPISSKSEILVQNLHAIQWDIPAPRQQDLQICLCLPEVPQHAIHKVVAGVAHQELLLLMMRGQVDEAIPLHGVAIATVQIVAPCVEATAVLLSHVHHRRLIATPPVLSIATVRSANLSPEK